MDPQLLSTALGLGLWVALFAYNAIDCIRNPHQPTPPPQGGGKDGRVRLPIPIPVED